CRARASLRVARGCPRRSPPRSAETHATPLAHRERSRPAPRAHTPNAPCLRPCSGNTDADHDGSPDRVRTRRRGPRTGGSTPRVIPAPSRLRPVRVRGGAYPYFSLGRKVTKPHVPVKPACKRRRRRHAYAIKSGTIVQEMLGAARAMPGETRIIFAPESN